MMSATASATHASPSGAAEHACSVAWLRVRFAVGSPVAVAWALAAVARPAPRTHSQTVNRAVRTGRL